MSKSINKTQLIKADAETALYERIRELIVTARQTVARGVDLVQVYTNYEIGRHIVEHEQQGEKRATYGKEVLNLLSDKLIAEFGKGFSRSNLEYMRRFYLTYPTSRNIPQTPSGEFLSIQKSQMASGKSNLSGSSIPFSLSWSHYVFLISIKNPAERSFYEIEAYNSGWNIKELKRQFDSSLYERLALSRDKTGIVKLARKGQLVEKPEDILKEPLVLEFLGLSEQTRYSESDLETAIINQIEHFLLELGKGFLFEARQKCFTFDEEHFFVDLVFYNRLLHCYVLIDLKIGKLAHQDLGQMQMYVNYFDRFVKTKAENATIGIILCKKKSGALVEITLPKDANISAREYQLYLPGKEELQRKLVEWAKEAGN
jgi:predicted nuclease of restriction endonuclease-like (RecB) superfamily